MPVHILEMDYSDQYDFVLVGLSCNQREHRLAWALNRVMGWSLERKDDVVITVRTGSSSHPHFSFADPVDQTVIALLSNRGEGGWLLPEWPQFDYLLKAEGEACPETGEWCRGIRKVQFVSAAIPLSAEKLKSIHHLILS
jgi:hypothetical protein